MRQSLCACRLLYIAYSSFLRYLCDLLFLFRSHTHKHTDTGTPWQSLEHVLGTGTKGAAQNEFQLLSLLPVNICVIYFCTSTASTAIDGRNFNILLLCSFFRSGPLLPYSAPLRCSNTQLQFGQLRRRRRRWQRRLRLRNFWFCLKPVCQSPLSPPTQVLFFIHVSFFFLFLWSLCVSLSVAVSTNWPPEQPTTPAAATQPTNVHLMILSSAL